MTTPRTRTGLHPSLATTAVLVAGVSLLAAVCLLAGACSASPRSSGFAGDGDAGGSGSKGGGSGKGSGSSSNGGSGTLGTGNTGSGSGTGTATGPTVQCPANLMCNVSCSGSGTTTISGKVYDPAGANPLYNVALYVPAVPLVPLPRGVPASCDCGAIFQSGALTSAATGVDGSFTLNNAPVGSNVPLVIQIGKWRRQYTITVNACTDNAQPNLSFLSTVPAGDTNDNIPDIAVSTGSADTLECLMLRIGLSASEYVAGNSTAGHVHIFSGGGPQSGYANYVGRSETNPMAGAPPSYSSLWDTQADLMPYDLLLLSCEGGETYNANPPAFEAYLNAGGRAFASHFHYSWFSGPIKSNVTYAAPSDWGSNLATWTFDQSTSTANNASMPGYIDQTLNGQNVPFPKGVAMNQWLTNVGALSGGTLPIYQPRLNATVSATDTPSQPWITQGPNAGGNTLYFSFDAPVMKAPPPPDSTGPTYCGRAVFSDLHVNGNPTNMDSENNSSGGAAAPGGCSPGAGNLSPQEKALEFMLFDLSSCVIPDTVPPPDAGVPSQTPQ